MYAIYEQFKEKEGQRHFQTPPDPTQRREATREGCEDKKVPLVQSTRSRKKDAHARDARRSEYVPLVSTEWCCCVCWLVVVVLLFSREVTAVVLLASGEMQHFSRQDQDQSCLGQAKCCISPGRRFSINQCNRRCITCIDHLIPHACCIWSHQGWAGAV